MSDRPWLAVELDPEAIVLLSHCEDCARRTSFALTCGGRKSSSQPAGSGVQSTLPAPLKPFAIGTDQLIDSEAHVSNPSAPPTAQTAESPFRWVLRDTTHDVHQRLHRHDGFAAIQTGAIDLAAYRRLLFRLHGFYVPFEAAADVRPDRSAWLESDLRALGMDPTGLGARAMCNDIPCLNTAAARLGALYVVEGSALGGRHLARNLDGLLGAEAIDGRRFFVGRGSGTGEAWRRYLSQLSAGSSDPLARTRIIDAALETFAVFESWLSDWNSVK